MEIVKKNFFKQIADVDDFKKTYVINADDDIYTDPTKTITTSTGVHFYTIFEKYGLDLKISIQLMAWSNDKQEYVAIENSVWAIDFDDGRYLQTVINYYTPIVYKLLDFFNNLKYFREFKELFYRFENPTFVYHYKLLNTFTQDELKEICSHFDFSKPILNTVLINNKNTLWIHEHKLFLPFYIGGFFLCGNFEIYVDLNESDFASIESDSGIISKEEFFKLIR